MYYDTQIGYNLDQDESIFELNDFTYYLTKTGKAKKQNKGGKKFSITKEEYIEMKRQYDWIFN